MSVSYHRTAYFVSLLVLTLTACGGDSTAPPDPGPAFVVVTAASKVHNDGGNFDDVTVTLKNNGGRGSYILDSIVLPTCPGCALRTVSADPVVVIKGYQETLTYRLNDWVTAVKVRTRTEGTAIYTQTDCKSLDGHPEDCP